MDVPPLTSAEERTWRALTRLMTVLPRAIDEDLQRATGLTMTEYAVLMHLSEAADRQLRMSDLAERTDLSASRMTRVIDRLQRHGDVQRARGAGDAREMVATLTGAGFDRLRAAWPAHLAGVRTLGLDHLRPADLARLADAAEGIVAGVREVTGGAAPACPVDRAG